MNFDGLVFIKPEMFKNPERLDRRLLRVLDNMMAEERKVYGPLKLSVHSDYREGSGNSQHHYGRAVDLDIEQENGILISAPKLFLIACRYMFSGIGFYPYWSRPGIHVDTRPTNGDYLTLKRAFWWRDEGGKYCSVYDFFKEVGK